MNKKAILLSGEAGCGKGVAAEAIQNMVWNWNSPEYDLEIHSCKDHLHETTMTFFNVPAEKYYEIYEDRKLKETPSTWFRVKYNMYLISQFIWDMKISSEREEEAISSGWLDLSIREALIFVSEGVLKPLMGKDWWGVARANNVLNSRCNIALDDSASAFEKDGVIECSEVEPLKDVIGEDNILLIRVTRPDNPYKVSDSRRMIPDGVIKNTVDVINMEGKEVEYLNEVCAIVEKFLEVK